MKRPSKLPCLIFLSFALLFSINFAQKSFGQQKLNYGLSQPQDPASLPKSLAPAPVVNRKAKIAATTKLIPAGNNDFLIDGAWEMIEDSKVNKSGALLSKGGVNTTSWFNATVPGTVLTTLVDQGVFPDPYFGLNNMYIPDTLCRTKWWYRTSFKIPSSERSKSAWINLEGTNYHSVIWLNGNKLGEIKGAFKRGIFNVSKYINRNGDNYLAVQILPPPHPGIPHEQSKKSGMGPNGGMLVSDGPTFISSEGWDWVPGIRDRNIGIWQPVKICFTGNITVSDPQVITDLNLPDTTKAYVTVKATVSNHSNISQKTVLKGSIEGVSFAQTISLAAGESRLVSFTPQKYNNLIFKNPRLWWPNGYGKPNLYKLQLSVSDGNNSASDQKSVRFGVREFSYELMVDAPEKQGVRINYDPTDLKLTTPFLDNTKRREVTKNTFIPTLREGVDLNKLEILKGDNPFIVIKVNGQKIFCKGGNWGMDDGMKRVSRSQLEPAFRLHKEANYTMIRNWTGESTEEVFYDLADEYGLLVWNDFWMSTQGYNVPPSDHALLLSNSLDVIKRFRNHPSIAIWCPRNEGYAPDGIEDELATQLAIEDGTRHYIGNSRTMNTRNSGDWHYIKDPREYFTKYAEGFSTEIGTFSVPTAATIRKFIQKEDQWPISDAWHYHDLHSNNQNLEGYLFAVDSLYGKPADLDDFCRKVQLINYESHRAMFEAWNSKLWENGSGVLLWMTHPAWPSMIWQTYSWDFETHGSYFGAKKACEPLHVQMNLTDNKVLAINTSLKSYDQATVSINVFDAAGTELYKDQKTIKFASNTKAEAFTPDFTSMKLPEIYLVRLSIKDASGKVLAENSYWKSNAPAKDFLAFNKFDNVQLTVEMQRKENDKIYFSIENKTKSPAIGVKLNLVDENKNVILPAYISDGYFTLLPGENKLIEVIGAPDKKVGLKTEGYNISGGYIFSKL